jgi:DNA invertase Pin-like site-specific DNA recombinase
VSSWLQDQGLDGAAVQWFEDIERGQTLLQPSFARFQRVIETGAIMTVVVWKFDRLARRQQDGINVLTDWCARNVRVIGMTQQIDLSGSVGRMVARHKTSPPRSVQEECTCRLAGCLRCSWRS